MTESASKIIRNISAYKVDLWVKPVLTPVAIREGEASYIGAMTISLPDPLCRGPLTVRITTSDEGDETLNEFQARFPGTIRVEKRLLPKTKMTTLVGPGA
jgi:hypothetical protein